MPIAIDPRLFLEPFDGLNYRDPAALIEKQKQAGKARFDEQGYMEGEGGAKISAGHKWLRWRKERNPNDYDVALTVIAMPELPMAMTHFERMLKPGAVEAGRKLGLKADEVGYSTLGPVAMLDLRYGRYLFKLVGINEVEIKLFDAHVQKVLRR